MIKNQELQEVKTESLVSEHSILINAETFKEALDEMFHGWIVSELSVDRKERDSITAAYRHMRVFFKCAEKLYENNKKKAA